MSEMLLMAMLCWMPSEGAASDRGGELTRAAPRAFHEIHNDLRALIRREARAKSNDERADAIYEMTVLYREILEHPRLPSSDTLKQYRAKLWSRLTRVKTELERHLGRAARGQPRHKLGGPSALAVRQATQSMVAQLDLLGYSLGGPATVFSQGERQTPSSSRGLRGGAARPDYGPALVDLIERTIAPGFWDVHGGPGTIVYYAPLHALVVRATSEVHAQIGGALGGLRKAGR